MLARLEPTSQGQESKPGIDRRYNMRVPETTPHDEHKHRRHAVYASETTGLLLIAFMLLLLTLVRYWHDIHWSLR